MEFIKIGKLNIAININWEFVDGVSNKKNLEKNVKKLAKKNNNRFGALSSVIHDKQSQYYLFNSAVDFDGNNIYAGATLLAENFKNHIIVKSLVSEKIEERKYWVLSIDSDGFIFDEGDTIISEDDLETHLDSMISITGAKLVTFEEDNQNIYNNFDFKVSAIINAETLESHPDLDYFKIKILLVEKKKYKLILACSTSLVLSSLSMYIYLQDMTHFDYITNQTYLEANIDYDSKIQSWKKEHETKKKKNTFTQEEFYILAKKQLLDTYDSQFFTNEEIVNNFKKVEKNFPIFIAEWKLQKIAYTKNQFIVFYKKIEDSNGIYTDLDNKINSLSKEHKLSITPVGIENNGTIRIYTANFPSEERRNAFFSRKKIEESIETPIDSIKRLEKDSDKYKSELDSIKNSVEELNIIDKYFSNKIDDAYYEIDNINLKIKDIYKKMIFTINKKEKNIEIPKDFLSGNAMKFIELTQKNVEYDWSLPNSGVKYPIIKSKRENATLIPFATSYKVKVSSDLKTKGFFNFSEAVKIINSPSFIFDVIEYETERQEWVVDGRIFEKF